MKNLFFVLCFGLLIASAASAAQANHGGKHIVAGINGLVCDYCAQALKRTFNRMDAVAATDVDLSAKTVRIDLKPGKNLSDTDVKKGVINAGYDMTSISRDE